MPLYEKAFGRRDLRFALALDNLAGIYGDQGKYAQAEAMLETALDINRSLALEGGDVSLPLINLGEIYRNQGRYAQAERSFKNALFIRENRLGSDDMGVTLTLA